MYSLAARLSELIIRNDFRGESERFSREDRSLEARNKRVEDGESEIGTGAIGRKKGEEKERERERLLETLIILVLENFIFRYL